MTTLVTLSSTFATPLTAFAALPPTLAALGPAAGAFDWLLDAFGAVVCVLGSLLGTSAFCHPFMQRALLAALCVGVVAPLVGTFLVHRQMSLIGETLAHTAFAGVAIGLFLGSALSVPISPYLSALVVAVLAALAIEFLAEHTDAYGDVPMAIVLAGGFALGSVVVSHSDGGISVGINQYLFGSLSTVTRENAALLLVLSLFVVGIVALTYKQLLFVTFDETAARVASLDVPLYNRLVVVLTAVVVVAAMQIMGVILVAAMLVVPVAAATQVARSFRESLVLSVVAAEIAALGGVVLSYAFGLAAGGTIVLVAIGVYGIAVLAGALASRTAVDATVRPSEE